MPVTTDPDYRKMAEKTFDALREDVRTARTIQSDYGKWLVMTLGGAHLGGLYLVASSQSLPLHNKWLAVYALTSGLLAALLSGLSTWWNFTLSARQYFEWANANMLINSDYWPGRGRFRGRILFTLYLAMVLGLLSAACIPIAVYLASLGWVAPVAPIP